ncbi:GGDEF domain-containing protein [Martelella endophytica]|uniref:GGDEF domain-containing protein n=1 Tax=Martelella endophytica TaxID=1486262 RepID=UPI0006961DF0|nr:GGDEF domain-containing protein [Martelella endophytica]
MGNNNGEATGLRHWYRSLSLRVWLSVGMAAAMIPFVFLSLYGFTVYRNDIAEPFRNVLNAQHQVLVPLERIQSSLWDISAGVIDFAEEGDESDRINFEATEREITGELKELEDAADQFRIYRPLLESIEQEWGQLIEAAAAVQAPDSPISDPALRRFEGVIAETARRMGALAEEVRIDSEKSHRDALAAMRRFDIFAATAGVFAILFAAIGIYIIDRALIASTDKLVAGAMRFAAGDREREIDVQVPPELASVADAFNVMTKQIMRQERALATAASTDSLTGLGNRREFDRVLADQIETARDTRQPFALLMLDLDFFKKFNDENGHPAGDSALVQISEVIAASARESDHVFRYGGEEFAMIMPAMRHDRAIAAAERLRKTVEDTSIILPNGEHRGITVSIGVMVYGADGSQSEVLGMADRALYEAKTGGRNAVKVAS